MKSIYEAVNAVRTLRPNFPCFKIAGLSHFEFSCTIIFDSLDEAVEEIKKGKKTMGHAEIVTFVEDPAENKEEAPICDWKWLIPRGDLKQTDFVFLYNTKTGTVRTGAFLVFFEETSPEKEKALVIYQNPSGMRKDMSPSDICLIIIKM